MIVVEERCVLHKEGAEMNMDERAGVVGRRVVRCGTICVRLMRFCVGESGGAEGKNLFTYVLRFSD
jgi:hypothetical protein